MITVVRAGPLTTVQDLGRPGYAHLGVPRSGALDGPALRRANALAGNPPDAAGLETTLLGCALRFGVAARVAVTGAAARVRLDKEPVTGEVIEVPAGSVLDVGRATRGVRSYLAVAGGIDVEPVLGSRSTDTLSGLGPPKLADGMTLPVGAAIGTPAAVDPAPPPGDEELVLGVWLGPRDDWFEAAELFGSAYAVSPVSNRVGCRLAGTAVPRARAGELALGRGRARRRAGAGRRAAADLPGRPSDDRRLPGDRRGRRDAARAGAPGDYGSVPCTRLT